MEVERQLTHAIGMDVREDQNLLRNVTRCITISGPIQVKGRSYVTNQDVENDSRVRTRLLLMRKHIRMYDLLFVVIKGVGKRIITHGH